MGDIFEDSDISNLFKSVTELSDAHAYQITVDFDRRFKVWVNQILPGRLYEIRTENTVEFVHRMMNLLFADGDRLTNRVIKESHENDIEALARIANINNILKKQIAIYLDEIDRIKLNKGNINEN